MSGFAGRISETTNTVGTGTVSTTGATAGCRPFTTIGTSYQAPYVLVDGNGLQYEEGYGTYSSGTFSRDNVTDGTNGAGTPINLSASTPHVIYIDDHASYLLRGEAARIVPPASAFSWVNQNGSTVTSRPGSIVMNKSAGSTGDNISALVVPVPSTPYTVSALVRYWGPWRANCKWGVCWYASGSGSLVLLGQEYNSTAGQNAAIPDTVCEKYTNTTTFTADYLRTNGQLDKECWFRMRDDGTNRYSDMSANGLDWVNVHSVSRTDFITPTHLGIQSSVGGSAGPYWTANIELLSWTVNN